MKKIMTLSVITGYLLIMSALGIVAAVPARTEQAAKEAARKEIVRSIYTANIEANNVKPTELKATVRVDETGKVTVSDISSGSEILKQYVVYQLEKMTIQNITKPETFVLLIRFVQKQAA